MIRFVDLRGAKIGDRFAFFDTVTDRFIAVMGSMTWYMWCDFEEDWLVQPDKEIDYAMLTRCKNLCPQWVFTEDEGDSDDY